MEDVVKLHKILTSIETDVSLNGTFGSLNQSTFGGICIEYKIQHGEAIIETVKIRDSYSETAKHVLQKYFKDFYDEYHE